MYAAATTTLVPISNRPLNRKLVVNAWEYVEFNLAACPRYHTNGTPCGGGVEEKNTCAYFCCGQGHSDPGRVCFHPRHIPAANSTNKLRSRFPNALPLRSENQVGSIEKDDRTQKRQKRRSKVQGGETISPCLYSYDISNNPCPTAEAEILVLRQRHDRLFLDKPTPGRREGRLGGTRDNVSSSVRSPAARSKRKISTYRQQPGLWR